MAFDSSQFTTSFWYDWADEETLPGKIFSTVEEIEEDQFTLRTNWRKYALYYSNRHELGLNWGLNVSTDAYESLVTENVVKSVIDTAASIIAKNQVRCRVLTNGAEWSDQRKARKLEQYLFGEFHARDVWALAPEVFRDACVFGTGVVKVIPNKARNRVEFERVLIDEIVVDEKQALRGKPRELHQRRLVDKNVLVAQFPRLSEEIRDSGTRDFWAGYTLPNNQVMVIESWRLPDSKNAVGRHTIVVDKAILLDEKYVEEDFPFVWYRWDGCPISGFYGLGLARDLQGFQVRLNQLNNFIQRCQDLIAVPRVFVDVASKVLKIEIDNKIGAIIPYRGKPPTFFTPQALNSEIYSYKDQIKRAAFEFAGISQLSAQSLKPAGLESAVALREYSDIETSRFVIQAQRYEKFFMQLGAKTIEAAKLVYQGQAKVKFSDRKVIHEIPWSDVSLENDRFELDIQPASLLSLSPSARLQAVTELAQVGQLDKSEIRYLLDHPDLRHNNEIHYADYEDIIRLKEKLFAGEYEPPEPFQNLDLGIKLLQLSYLKARDAGAPEDVLQNIRDWVAQANDLLTLAEPAPPAGPELGMAGTDPALAAGQAPIAGGSAGSDVIQNLAGPIAG